MRDDADKTLRPQPGDPVVRCADDLGKLYWFWRLKARYYAALVAIFLGFQVLADWIEWDWLMLVPFVLFISVFLPLLVGTERRRQSLLGSLECPRCDRPAGETFTRQGILHLRCRHCGKETRTDSLVVYRGPPTKV